MKIFGNKRKVAVILMLSVIVGLMSTGFSYAYGAVVADSMNKAEETRAQIAVLEVEGEECVKDMEAAHNMAENARALELSEDDVVIVKAQKIWNEKNERLTAINSELESLKANLVEYDKYSNMSYIGDFKLTGYCACKKCCGKDPSSPGYGITAVGTRATEGRTIAMDSRFPFGTKVYIEGVGYRTVEDRGGAIKGNRIDIYCDSHQACFNAAYNTTAKVYIVND